MSMAEEELLVEPEEEQVKPSILDPIKQKGVLEGGAELLGNMLPGSFVANQAQQRGQDGYSVKDIFSSLLDVGTSSAYFTPIIGDALGTRDALNIWDDPDADSLTKAMGVMGVIGLVPLAASAGSAVKANRALQSARAASSLPVSSRHLFGDTLSHLSGVIDEPVKAQSLLATLGDSRGRKVLQVLQSTDFEAQPMDRSRTFDHIRTGLQGEKRLNNGDQAIGFLDTLGSSLIEKIPSYRQSVNSLELTPDQVAVSAVAYETAKIDYLVKTNKLSVGETQQNVIPMWEKFIKGDELLAPEEVIFLHDAIVDMANLTQGTVHPHFAFDDIRFGLDQILLDGSNSKVFINVLDHDGVSLTQLTEEATFKRIVNASEANEASMLTHFSQNVVEFFDQEVRGPLGDGSLVTTSSGTPGLIDHTLSASAGFTISGQNKKVDKLVERALEIASASLGEVATGSGVKTITGPMLRGLINQVFNQKLDQNLSPSWAITGTGNLRQAKEGGIFYHSAKSGKIEVEREYLHMGTLESAMMRAQVHPNKSIPVQEYEVRPQKPYFPDGKILDERIGKDRTELWIMDTVGKTAKDNLRAQGYDSVPYINAVEAEGQISYMILDPRILKPLRRRTVQVKGDTDFGAGPGKDIISAPRDGAGQVIYHVEVIEEFSNTWVKGQGPARIYNDNLLNMLQNPAPNKLGFRAHPPRTSAPKQVLHELLKAPSTRKGSGTLVVAARADGGVEIVSPLTGKKSKGRNRGTYSSVGGNSQGQHVRLKVPMRVADTETTAIRIAESTTVGSEEASTGFRKMTTNHKSWAFEDGRHIVISTTQSSDAVQQHQQISLLLEEAGIPHKLTLEEPHIGQSKVWRDRITGEEYWSVEEFEAQGVSRGNLTLELHEEPRVQIALTFEDPDSLSRAWHILHEPTPHNADLSVQGINTVSSEYVRHYAREYGLKIIPRGIKREIEFIDAGVGTSVPELYGRKIDPKFAVSDRKTMVKIAREYATKRKTKKIEAETASQYSNFIIETDAQFQWITEQAGVRMEVVDTNPYASPMEMAADIRDNKRLKVLSTESTGGHPLLTNAQNDKFRFVHDYFGHSALGNSFTRHGEYVAYLKHGQMYSEAARGAMHSETVGQNAWLVFSPENEAKAWKALRHGQSYAGDFIDQRAIVLDKKYWSNKALSQEAGYMTGADKGRRIDGIYNEEILDISAYTYGPDEAPIGTKAVFEHHFEDEAASKLIHMSRDGDVNSPNTEVAYVAEDGMYQYFGDSETKVHQAGKGSTGFSKINNEVWWQGVAKVLNPEGGDFLDGAHKDLFDVRYTPAPDTPAEFRSIAPTRVYLYIPPEGQGVPLLAFTGTGADVTGGQEAVTRLRAIAKQDQNMGRIITLTRKGAEIPFEWVEDPSLPPRKGIYEVRDGVRLPPSSPGVDPFIVDDYNHFMGRTNTRKRTLTEQT